MSKVIPLYSILSAMLMTKMVGISKSLICVNKSKLRFRFSTSVTTIATSGYSLSFVQHQLNDNIFINGTGIQTVRTR
jgi:hypothetical protein